MMQKLFTRMAALHSCAYTKPSGFKMLTTCCALAERTEWVLRFALGQQPFVNICKKPLRQYKCCKVCLHVLLNFKSHRRDTILAAQVGVSPFCPLRSCHQVLNIDRVMRRRRSHSTFSGLDNITMQCRTLRVNSLCLHPCCSSVTPWFTHRSVASNVEDGADDAPHAAAIRPG